MFLYSQIQFQQGEHLVAVEGMRLYILRSKREHGERHFLTLYREAEVLFFKKIILHSS